MPLIRGSASDVTRFQRLQTAIVADPTRKSASYARSSPELLPSLRATPVVSPTKSVLSSPIWFAFKNPRHYR